jgi:hypothetical protein
MCRSVTAVETLLTFWPPGPADRAKNSSNWDSSKPSARIRSINPGSAINIREHTENFRLLRTEASKIPLSADSCFSDNVFSSSFSCSKVRNGLLSDENHMFFWRSTADASNAFSRTRSRTRTSTIWLRLRRRWEISGLITLRSFRNPRSTFRN